VSGIKRHIVVDTQGLPHAIAVTTANVTDRQGALDAIKQHSTHLSAVTSFLVDGGYTGKPFAESVRTLTGASVQVAQRHELHTFSVLPQRWVVERSFAWLEKCRRLWKIPSACSIPACNSSIWLFWCSCCGDIEQALRPANIFFRPELAANTQIHRPKIIAKEIFPSGAKY
jgi:transposase